VALRGSAGGILGAGVQTGIDWKGWRRDGIDVGNPASDDLSTEYLVYTGNSSFDELAALAREGGMEAVRNEGNRQESVEKVWT